jgi:uncharacterized protein
VGNERIVTPSKITAWLDCPHYLTLTTRVDDGLLAKPSSAFGSFAQLLADKGLTHEQDCLAEYRARGKSVFEVPAKLDGEPFTAWVARVGNPLDSDDDVLYQVPFIHDGIRGVADFLERVHPPGDNRLAWEPVDAKLTRAEAKPGHVLQLCFYADAIEAKTGVPTRRAHIWLGSGRRETLRVKDFRAYWRRLRKQIAQALVESATAETVPRRCPHCPFCEFNSLCEDQWRSEDSLIYVAGIRQPDIESLKSADVGTLTALAQGGQSVSGMQPEHWARLVRQAELQLQARSQETPPFEIIASTDDPTWGRGFEKLPEPDNGDVFIDFEGHPFWRADTGLFFLFGLLERDEGASWTYRTWWAHDVQQEANAAQGLIGYLADRREHYPGMHVYHYNHTERTALQNLVDVHGFSETEMAELVDTGAFVDLYILARNSIQVGTESYGLKHLERLTEFERSHEIDKGAGAVVQYEQFMTTGDKSELNAIAVYNEDDVRATMALRDWMVEHRPPDTAWREAWLVPPPGIPELDERVTRLHAYSAGSIEHLLGDLLGYWWREWLAYFAPKRVKLETDPAELIDDPEVIAALQQEGLVERLGAKGTPITPAMRFAFPPQVLDRFPRVDGLVTVLTPDGEMRTTSIHRLDRDAGVIDLVWGPKLQEAAISPRVGVLNGWVDPKPKAFALQSFADDVLAGHPPNAVTMALFRHKPPRFVGTGPAGGAFSSDLDDMTDWVKRLSDSFVAIQGPPGSGKTYCAAHLVHVLVMAGSRVGVTATSHHAIVNLLEAIFEVFEDQGDAGRLSAVRNPGAEPTRLDWMHHGGNDVCARSEFNLVAGTGWLFSSAHMRSAPVDVLVIDEAGQLSLADALAASTSAHNILLLGDPQQLPQVAQASHPNASGVSVLDHVIGEDSTIRPDRGVFLSETRRMHPDIADFIF